MSQTLDTAIKYLAAGYSVVPVKLDGSKAPHGQWKTYLERKATDAELRRWFPDDRYAAPAYPPYFRCSGAEKTTR